MIFTFLISNIFSTLVSAYNWINLLATRLTGYSLRDGWTKHNYESDFHKSAHRYRILFRHDFHLQDPVFGFSDKNFPLFHQKWEDPVSSILENEQATLYGLTCTHAIFAVVTSGENVYDSNVGPFVPANQLKLAKELVYIPLQHFVKLSAMVPDLDPNVKVLLLSNTGRCGSTLLTKMLEGLDGRVLSMSEPEFINKICHLRKRLTVPLDDVLRAGFKLQINKKGTVRKGIGLVVFKSRSPPVQLIPDVARAIPKVSHVFMYRSPRNNMASTATLYTAFFKTGNPGPNQKDRRIYGVRMESVIIEGMENEEVMRKVAADVEKNFTPARFGAAFWAMKVHCFLESRRRGVDVMPLSNEELVKDPSETLIKLLEHCGLSPLPPLEGALQAMGEDSQKNSRVSRERLKEMKKLAGSTPLEEQEINNVFRKCGFPPMKQYTEIFQ